ncbi:Predicted DNA-binding transcriptional regulator YafY, contains an HTH and WYL domains [Marinomonas polaris DSM 16579]|uniref:Predicted DNA-binding transcriptional regulator YafY, contains an HTH and WYL domains n=1 Tax=Marinomonas polaris DSM 16579 TaxID=1122206 RepID=A0A1M4XGW6_9GAMM|nr:YafY family protein [Marinomonas polaris]SHE92735.1 Predicted DNA-binding transcriptional regulator YafY, contains an HTH and WYL domains [Marinomonas polaris DSM 16579]|tara:strand:+ start:13397 stop:14374 length:978 start_codon:yes stop_codon:yes gene_type:complete
MRASRILKMLMMLQTHEKVTAAELADACETSIRTVYRDIEALSAIGVPVYSEQGVQGGYRLLQGYRTRLNGLSAKEAETLFLAGLSGPAQKMGIDTLLADAQLKLKAALPENIRPEIDRLQSRFLLDAPNWFSDDEKVTYLPDLMTAVLEQRCVVMQYQSWKGEINRQLQPLGIVLKGGQWYLLAQVEKDVRTYRVSRIESLTLLDEVFERPKDFNLAAFWQDSLRRMETIQFPIIAEVRLTVLGLKIMQYVCSSYAVNQAQIEPMDESGWHRARFPVGESVHGCAELLRFGAELEVIGPPELRAEMEKMVSSLARLYQQDAARS